MNHEKLNSLADRLIGIPQEILVIQTNILEKSQDLQKISNEILRFETNLRVEIATQVDENGKKAYSNDDSRKAAFVESSNSSIELGELREKHLILDLEIQRERISFECINSEQRNIRALLQFFSKELV